MNLRPTEYGWPSEWQDQRPSLPWRQWLSGLITAVLCAWLVGILAQRMLAPAPPVPLPEPLRLTQAIAQRVEETRGLESLFVMLENSRERRELETRLLQQRERLTDQVAALTAALPAADEQRRVLELNKALGQWWAVQDQMVVELQPRVVDRDRVARARLLLTVDSQQRYEVLLTTIDGLARRLEQ